MTKVPLIEGAYTARGVIASAQRCVNLYQETNPKDADEPVTHYPTPGLSLRGTPPVPGVARGLYRATNGGLYYCVGRNLYYVSPTWHFTLLGSIVGNNTPVAMLDNGIDLVLVDGTPKGYTVGLLTGAFAQITDVNFLGSSSLGYLDTFMLFNQPDTKNFYSTLSNVLTFNPVYIAAKTGFPDKLQGLTVGHREIVLVGQLTGEIWYNAGNANFPFAITPGTFIELGTPAKYSIARHGIETFWVTQDKDGQRFAVSVSAQGNYQPQRISTFAIETAWQKYGTVSDIIAFTYQQGGHIFYVVNFPSEDKTWVFDQSVGLWHERAWIDSNGEEHRWRANCSYSAYGKNLVGDWETGNLYELDLETFTDNGDPVVRRRGFPHLTNDGMRVVYTSFTADIECGNNTGLVDGSTSFLPPELSLRWSDTRGKSWGNPVKQSLGSAGQYLTQPQWARLGLARDRVFELFWSTPELAALNGAYIDAVPLGS